MEWLTDPQMWVAFLTLTVLELVLGIDNVVFISILAGNSRMRSSRGHAPLAWVWPCCCGSRCSSRSPGSSASPRHSLPCLGRRFGGDLILLIGGLFLLAKSTLNPCET